MITWFLFLYINVALADFMTGVQSIDQIFFGTTIGIWLGFFCNAFVRKPLDAHITRLLNGEYRLQGHGKLVRNLMIIVLVDFSLCTGLYLIVSNVEDSTKYT